METLWCFFFCFGKAQAPAPKQISGFCEVYQQQVLNKAEVKAVLSLPKDLRTRMQGNELFYLCYCKGTPLKECARVSKSGA